MQQISQTTGPGATARAAAPTLCRAFVYLPNHMRTPERAERTVFFEAASSDRAEQYRQLASLLALTWNVPAAALLEEGVIYNLSPEPELREEHLSPGDFGLLEIGSGGRPEWPRAVTPPGGGHIPVTYARADEVDLFVSPRNSARLRKALASVEALYAAKGGLVGADAQ